MPRAAGRAESIPATKGMRAEPENQALDEPPMARAMTTAMGATIQPAPASWAPTERACMIPWMTPIFSRGTSARMPQVTKA